MIKNEDTYCTVQHKIVRELGAMEAVIYGTIVNLLRKSDGIGEVSNQTLMELCGINNKMGLYRYIKKLIETGYIEKRAGDGRGNISIYYVTKKGNNMLPFNDKKGNKNDTERVTKMNEKGNTMLPINKGENKEINKESGGDMRTCAQSPTPFDTTPLNFENMEDFNLFWELYPGDPNWSNEKENCERVWYAMQQNWRDNLIQQLLNGKRWRVRDNDNPYWYLKNYNGETMRSELPIMRQGTISCTKWLNESVRNGKRVCVMLMGEGDDTHSVFCLEEDRKECENAGLRFVRYY